MRRSVIVIRTANRPDILNRCIEAAVYGCCVARDALWVVLDDSFPDFRAGNREITQFWKAFGLRLAYVDKTVEAEIADFLPGATFRSSFAHLVLRRSANRTEGGRNLALLAGFSLDADVIFLVDDNMVIRHEGNCFFHWCVSIQRADSFVAAPRKLGIGDMMYLHRLANILKRDEWAQFVSEAGISADPGSWYSPANPLWKRRDNTSVQATATAKEREVLNGQLMALCGKGADWIPFPSGSNEDLNWSFLQAAFHGTALLKANGMNAQHLPPCIGHAKAEVIISELVGTATTRALRQIKPRGEQVMSTLAGRLPDILRVELKRELALFIAVERGIDSRLRTCAGDTPADRTLSKIKGTLADVAERLKSVDSRQLAGEWLNDFADRQRMFSALRRNETVQLQIRRILFQAGV